MGFSFWGIVAFFIIFISCYFVWATKADHEE